MELKAQVDLLDKKIVQNQKVISEMDNIPESLKVSSAVAGGVLPPCPVSMSCLHVLPPCPASMSCLHVLSPCPAHALLQKSAASTKNAIAVEYQQIRELLAQEEQKALLAVDRELDNSHVKLKVLSRKFAANISKLSEAKEAVQRELRRPHTLAFLQVPAQPTSTLSWDAGDW